MGKEDFLQATSPPSASRRRGRGYKLQANIAASAQQAIVDVLVEKTIRAAKKYKVKTILLGGVVSANIKLRKTLGKKIKQDLPDTLYVIPDTSLATDNAAMIAFVGYLHTLKKVKSKKPVVADANWEIQ